MNARTTRASRKATALRVVHVLSDDTWGGAESQVFGLLRELRRHADLDIDVLLFNDGLLKQRLGEAGFEVTVIPERLGSTRLFTSIITHLRRTQPDVVHTHGYKQNVLGGLAAVLVGCASIRTQHGDWEISSGWADVRPKLHRAIDTLVARFAQRKTVAVSDALAAVLRRQLPHSKVQVIENGLYFNAAESRDFPRPMRREVVIAFVGRLVPVKRVDLFLEAAALLLRNSAVPLKFRVYGDGPLASHAAQLVERLKISRHVELLGFTADIQDHLRRADLLVMTSDHEGLPMILLEALWLELPVIAPPVGAIPKVLKPEFGILVPTQSAPAYRDAVATFLERRSSFREALKSAPQFIADFYSARRQAEQYYELYRSLCRPR